MASAGTVTLDLDANSVRLLRELKKSQRATERTARKMRSSMTRAFSAIRSSALTAASAFGVFAAARTIRGIAEAGVSMERLERGLKTATGSAQGAAEEIQFLRQETERLGINFEQSARAYTKLAAAARGTAIQGAQTRQGFLAISEAAAVLGLSADQTAGALTAVEQIISKGKVSAEELRGQLGERLPGAFQIAARSMNVTTSQLDKMLSTGTLLSDEFLPKFFQEVRNTFSGGVVDAADSAQAAFNRFSNSIFNLKAAFAESGLLDTLASAAGYLTTSANAVGGFLTTTLEERKKQIANEILYLNDLIESRNAGVPQGREDNFTKQLMLQREGLLLELELTNTRIDKEKELQKQREKTAGLLSEIDVGKATTIDSELQKIFDKNNKEIESLKQHFTNAYATAEQEVARELADFNLVSFMFPPGERERIRNEIRDALSIDEIDPKDFAPTAITEGTKNLFSKMIEDAEDAKKAARELGLTFSSAFEDAIVEGSKLSDVLKGLYKDIIRIFVRKSITEPLGGFFAELIGPIFGKASGGPVSAGTPYVVGEHGPELFVPGIGGSIVPNHGMGGTSVIYQISVDARADRQQIIAEMIPLLDRTRQITLNEVRQESRRGRL